MMQTEDIVALMAEVSAATIGGDGGNDSVCVSSSSSIFALCQQLQVAGPHLEQTHKAELSRVFAALRQACCRDSGSQQLGLDCRRRVMELIELRAMGWRPKLSHTQYYLTRNNSDGNNNHNSNQGNCDAKNWESYTGRNDVEYKKLTYPLISNSFQLPTAKKIAARHINKSATNSIVPKSDNNGVQIKKKNNNNKSNFNNPNNNFNNNNTNFNNNDTLLLNCPRRQRLPAAAFSVPPPQPPPLFVQSPPLEGTPPTPNDYFVMPATGSWSTSAVQMMSAAATAAAAIYPVPPPPLMSPPQFFLLSNEAPISAAPIKLSTISGILNAKSIKSQQFREEVVIRNSDSGKIMGVKGRRVALIEELSRTVISFQKIDSKCRDRVLTVTGSTPESIREARRLVDETIRRNVSPTPVGRSPFICENGIYSEPIADSMPSRTEPAHPNQLADSTDVEASSITHADCDNTIVPEESDTPAGVFIQRSSDGSLRLCCDDPKVFEAAQTALCEYLNRVQPTKNSVDESIESKIGSEPDDQSSNDEIIGDTMPLRYTRDEILALDGSNDALPAAPLSETTPAEILRDA